MSERRSTGLTDVDTIRTKFNTLTKSHWPLPHVSLGGERVVESDGMDGVVVDVVDVVDVVVRRLFLLLDRINLVEPGVKPAPPRF